MNREEIQERIELALNTARRNTRNDQHTIDAVQDELWDAFYFWDEDEDEDEE